MPRPKSANKLRHVGAYITEELYTELKKVAAEKDRSISYIIVSLIKSGLPLIPRGGTGLAIALFPGEKPAPQKTR